MAQGTLVCLCSASHRSMRARSGVATIRIGEVHPGTCRSSMTGGDSCRHLRRLTSVIRCQPDSAIGGDRIVADLDACNLSRATHGGTVGCLPEPIGSPAWSLACQRGQPALPNTAATLQRATAAVARGLRGRGGLGSQQSCGYGKCVCDVAEGPTQGKIRGQGHVPVYYEPIPIPQRLLKSSYFPAHSAVHHHDPGQVLTGVAGAFAGVAVLGCWLGASTHFV
jgi:hypothetical protein